MLQAELRGKLRRRITSDIERLEDVLTSNVLGTMRYLPAEDALLPFLKSARNVFGEGLSLGGRLQGVTWRFWPRLGSTKEPDLALVLRTESGIDVLIVEAKYFSGKSSLARRGVGLENAVTGSSLPHQATDADGDPDDVGAGDQLEGYLRLLREDGLRGLPYDRTKVTSRRLIYLTRHATIPLDALRATAMCFRPNEQEVLRTELFWCNWQSALRAFDKLRLRTVETWKRDLVCDVCRLLERKGFTYWDGFRPAESEWPPSRSFWARQQWFEAAPAWFGNLPAWRLWERGAPASMRFKWTCPPPQWPGFSWGNDWIGNGGAMAGEKR